MSDDNEMEKIAEYREEETPGFITHDTLYFDPAGGAFVLESVGFGMNDGELARTELDSQEAYQWATEVAGMDPDEAARRVVGADSP